MSLAQTTNYGGDDVIFRGPCGLKCHLSTQTDLEGRDPASYLSTTKLILGVFGEKEIQVNSFLLDVSSPYFKSCFNGNYESVQQIDLSTFHYNAILRIIQYFYSGTLIISKRLSFALLKVAKKLELNEVIDTCIPIVKRVLQADRCLEVMSFCIKNGLQEIAATCEDLIRHNFKLISESEEFLNLDYENFHEIISYLIRRTNNDVILQAIIRWVKHDEVGRKSHLPHWMSRIDLESIYLNNRPAFQSAFAEGSILRNDSYCRDLCFKILLEGTEDRSNVSAAVVPTVPRNPSETLQPPDFLVYIKAEPMATPINGSSTGTRKRKNSDSDLQPHFGQKSRPSSSILSTDNVNSRRRFDGHPSASALFAVTSTSAASSAAICPETTLERLGCTALMPILEPMVFPVIHSKAFLYSEFVNDQKHIIQYDLKTHREKTIHQSNSDDVRILSSLVHFGERIFDIGGSPEKKVHPNWCVTSANVDVFTHGKSTPSNTKNKLIISRGECGTCAYGNYVYVIGGYTKADDNDGSFDIPQSERYPLNKRNGKWEEIQQMKFGRSSLGVAVLQNKIYAIGGIGANVTCKMQAVDSADLASVEVFDPSQMKNEWKEVCSLNVARAYVGVCVMNQKIYVIGGSVGVYDPLAAVEVYNQSSDTWSICANMNHPRKRPTVFEDGNLLYAIGGNKLGDTPSMEVYNPNTNRWSLCAWPEGLSHHAFQTDFNSGIVISTNSRT